MKNSPICVDASLVVALLVQSDTLAQLFGGELWTLDARLQRCFAEITPIVYLAT